MNVIDTKANSKTIHITYDAMQHCIARKEPQGKLVSMDCPYTWRGEEFSTMNLLSASLAGSIMLSMGAVAMRHEVNLKGLNAEVTVRATDPPSIIITAIDVKITMPRNFCESDRTRLERSASACPVKRCIDPAIPVTVSYHYPR